MRTIMLEVREIVTVHHIAIEATGTWPRVSSPVQGRAFARRRVDRTDLRTGLDNATEAVARMVGEACEDVVRQVMESER